MLTTRRARPTLRCLTEDLGLAIPGAATDLGQLDHPWLGELRRIAPVSPQGQKRILSIEYPVVYRLRHSAQRGLTWVDTEHGIVWLCAAHRREHGSDDDAYTWFARLHADTRLLPSADDLLRDRVEAVTRLQHGLRTELLQLMDHAVTRPGSEVTADLGHYLPARAVVLAGDGIEEIWCALSSRATDGSQVRAELRDILFAALESHFPSAIFEVRRDWPGGVLGWWEAVRLGLR
jgi:hypothetical protein